MARVEISRGHSIAALREWVAPSLAITFTLTLTRPSLPPCSHHSL